MHREGRAREASAGYKARSNRSKLPLICSIIAIVTVLAGIAILTVWLVYRPRKPKFRVVNAAVYELNATSPPFISTAMQFTVVARNPNKRLSILYDQFSAFVSYKKPGHHSPSDAATFVPRTQEHGGALSGARRRAGACGGGGGRRVVDGRGLWDGGSEPGADGEAGVQSWNHNQEYRTLSSVCEV
ncbi:hypothetical protein F511_10456 [Dorcoceras hygrometricum]|uniref:Late embryogenesis abundant protein LEA-2 subgroup domain-containing protein n=1 Tax=Dorcoceras hygrometricum TaxID=472368 RepID=A0A2Z7CX24_9LAMI|nr:hypothetical protein F511_10456 [Dorcoceras hygrometricum]